MLGLILLLLQSCQYSHKPQHHEAALYNMQLGLVYLNHGDRSRAQRKLKTALDQDPESPSANAAMGYFFEKAGEIRKAQLYYHKAMRLEPKGAQLNNYGAFLCRSGHYKEAEIYFIKAVHDEGYEHTAAVYENAGLCAMAGLNDIKATRYFRQALTRDPSRKQSLYELVTIDVKLGQISKAFATLQKYQTLCLHDPVLLALKANVSRKMRQTEL